MLTEKELELEQLDKARTQGEWFDIPHPEWYGANHRVAATSSELWTSFNQICYADSDDAAFIAACSVAIPRLLATVEVLRQALTRVEEYDEDGRNPWEAIEEMREIAIKAMKEEEPNEKIS